MEDPEHLMDYENKDYSTFWHDPYKKITFDREMKIMEELLTINSNWMVDLGCGYGRFLPIYLKKSKNVVMVDFSIKTLKDVKHKYSGNENVVFIAANLKNLPFHNNIFEQGVCIRTLNNISNIEPLIPKFSQYLKNNSNFIIGYFNLRSLLRLCKFGVQCLEKTHKYQHKGSFAIMCGTHPKYFYELMKNNYFISQKKRGSGFSYQLMENKQFIQRIFNKSHSFRRIMTFISNTFDNILGALNLSLWQIVQVELHKEPTDKKSPSHWIEILKCIKCHKGNFKQHPHKIVCEQCGCEIPIEDGVLNFHKT